MFQNIGENQVKEIIHASLCSVFFIDESQRVTLKDIGRIEEIEKWANEEDSEIFHMELQSQFRCNGSDGYLAWLDQVLEIRDTANTDMEDIDYDIQIGDFEMSWNLGNSSTYAIDETSVNEVGCIHTSQGLEFDYVGVIIGEDMRFENGHIVTDFTKRARTDQSLRGIKKLYKENPKKANQAADEIIKNTYRTLMTRGMKGCYIYCVDNRLGDYLREQVK